MFLKITYLREKYSIGLLLIFFLISACSTGKGVKVPEYMDNNNLANQVAQQQGRNFKKDATKDHLKIHEHALWTELLQKYVDSVGNVNYQGFIQDSVQLNAYLNQLSKHTVNDGWTYNQKKAYWINVYNAFTVKLIADNYPLKSIKDLGGGIYKVNTPWDIKFIKLGKKTYDLNNVEHSILRKDFADPRIHAAVNCASISCPKLRNEAYTADQLEEQLSDQMRFFVNNTSKNTIAQDKLEISPIFKWFSGDFTENGDLISFLNQYSTISIAENASISYKSYNWNLNE